MPATSSVNPGRRRVRLGLGLLAVVMAVGALWYWLVEGFSAVNALYQTVMTVTTVGFSEVEPLGSRGRVFTMLLIVVGVGVALYAIVGFIEDVLEHQLGRWGRKRMERQIDRVKDHIVLCGYGRVGRGIVPMIESRSPVVVVDREAERIERAQEAGLLAIEGDATDDDVLRAAGLERASTLVVSLQSDADAISTVLSARVINPGLRIVARANAENSEAKLVRAGVDHVVNPLRLGSVRLATFALQPAVADFVDLVGPTAGESYRLEQVVVPADSPVAGRRIAECRLREETGALVLALRRSDGEFESNPGADAVLVAGSTLVVIGTAEHLAALDAHLRAGGRRPQPSTSTTP
ncbi:MAG: potassium channel protein [Acidimicrobiia bacterium]